jgi:hypothetical protein
MYPVDRNDGMTGLSKSGARVGRSDGTGSSLLVRYRRGLLQPRRFQLARAARFIFALIVH